MRQWEECRVRPVNLRRQRAVAGSDSLGSLQESRDGRQLEELYEISETGTSLRAKKALKRISHGRGEELVKKAIEKAKEINSDKEFPCPVKQLILFGSMLEDTETIGDVSFG